MRRLKKLKAYNGLKTRGHTLYRIAGINAETMLVREVGTGKETWMTQTHVLQCLLTKTLKLVNLAEHKPAVTMEPVYLSDVEISAQAGHHVDQDQAPVAPQYDNLLNPVPESKDPEIVAPETDKSAWGHIDYNGRPESAERAKERVRLEAIHGQIWSTEELTRDFEVKGFGAPFVVVVRRSDGIRGSMEFQHVPRFYWGFTPTGS